MSNSERIRLLEQDLAVWKARRDHLREQESDLMVELRPIRDELDIAEIEITLREEALAEARPA